MKVRLGRRGPWQAVGKYSKTHNIRLEHHLGDAGGRLDKLCPYSQRFKREMSIIQFTMVSDCTGTPGDVVVGCPGLGVDQISKANLVIVS
jgi:hypothetical protein